MVDGNAWDQSTSSNHLKTLKLLQTHHWTKLPKLRISGMFHSKDCSALCGNHACCGYNCVSSIEHEIRYAVSKHPHTTGISYWTLVSTAIYRCLCKTVLNLHGCSRCDKWNVHIKSRTILRWVWGFYNPTSLN